MPPSGSLPSVTVVTATVPVVSCALLAVMAATLRLPTGSEPGLDVKVTRQVYSPLSDGPVRATSTVPTLDSASTARFTVLVDASAGMASVVWPCRRTAIC